VRISVPLNALRAFEAVARIGSVKEAAEEVGVTPSALSHHLRALEETLGAPLLLREGNRLLLTEAGEALLPGLTAGFQSIAETVADFQRDRTRGPLRVSALPTFAIQWLSPRLSTLQTDALGFDIQISMSQAYEELRPGTLDVALRHGDGEWPDLVSDKLFDEVVGLLGPPEIKGLSWPLMSDEIASRTLYLSRYREALYEEWLTLLGDRRPAPKNVMMVDSVGLGIQLALDNQGLTFAGLEITARQRKEGKLAQLLPETVEAGTAYYLVYPPALQRDVRIRRFREWLMDQKR